MMLRLTMWLIDMGIYKKVLVVFLIAGHTKNICDRRFKDMKKDCHHSDIFSLSKQLALMKGPHVTPIKVTSDDFKDWDKMLNDHYRKLAPNTTSINHVFTYEMASPGVLKTQRVNSSPIQSQWLVKGKKKQANWTKFNHEERQRKVQESVLEPVIKPGIKPIKQVEMYTKWLPLILDKPGSDILCPKPSDEVMNSVKQDKNTKAGEKRATKRKRVQEGGPLAIADATAAQGAITVAQPLIIDQATKSTDKVQEETV